MIRQLLRGLIEWALEPTAAQLREGYVTQNCIHCGCQSSGRYRARWCMMCGKGYGKE